MERGWQAGGQASKQCRRSGHIKCWDRKTGGSGGLHGGGCYKEQTSMGLHGGAWRRGGTGRVLATLAVGDASAWVWASKPGRARGARLG